LPAEGALHCNKRNDPRTRAFCSGGTRDGQAIRDSRHFARDCRSCDHGTSHKAPHPRRGQYPSAVIQGLEPRSRRRPPIESHPVRRIYPDPAHPDRQRFLLTASSFTRFPDLPILQFDRMVNWSIIGSCMQRQPLFDVFAHPQHGKGVWAPHPPSKWSVRHLLRDPEFGDPVVKADPNKPGRGQCGALLVEARKGWIDPCPLWERWQRLPSCMRWRPESGINRY